MTQPPEGILASDADRDAAADALADAVAAGRLSLPDHDARLDVLFAAVTQDQVAAVTADLPGRPARRGALYRAADPYRNVVIGGSARRAGRFTVGRFVTVLAAFGDLDLDLRGAVPSQAEVDLTVRSLAARVVITVPAGWQVTDQVLVAGRRLATADRPGSTADQPGSTADRPGSTADRPGYPIQPVLRLGGVCVGGSFRLTTGS
jgi:Domain of unknown function (DUF1707)